MSKKDRQHQHIQQPLTSQMMNQPEKATSTSGDPASMGSEARIRHLEAELEQAQRGYDALDATVRQLRHDLDILSKAARHGAPPEGVEPKTAEGKDALEQVVLLGNIAKEQREHATMVQRQNEGLSAQVNEAHRETRALRSDMMVLEQTAAGRAPDIALQTDIGKSAAHALSEVLTSLDMMNAQRLEGPALPLNGWASDTALQLVQAVPTHERVLLLGDLLAQLLPHAGEQGQNETASDVLKRKLAELKAEEDLSARTRNAARELEEQVHAQAERMVKIQSAIVARRAPDAEAGGAVSRICDMLRQRDLDTKDIVQSVARALQERDGLRLFFSESPLTAVAVRDDGHKGPVRERYSLLVLSWDGKAVQTQVVEGTRPWGDISPYLGQTVLKNLIPAAYR